jgi:hypothetical protein
MRIPKSAVVLSALVVGLGVSGVATASTAAPAPKQYGACVSVKNGSLRLLEPLRLRRSQYGACKSTERKIYLPTKHAIPVIPPPPATVIYKRSTGVETCTKTTDTVLTYECKTVPAPSPTPTPAS